MSVIIEYGIRCFAGGTWPRAVDSGDPLRSGDSQDEASASIPGYVSLGWLRRILTPKFYADGMHIALATVAEVDLLVSWNFRHIVRYDKIRLFTAVNLERGYKSLAIYSPREVASDEEDNH